LFKFSTNRTQIYENRIFPQAFSRLLYCSNRFADCAYHRFALHKPKHGFNIVMKKSVALGVRDSFADFLM